MVEPGIKFEPRRLVIMTEVLIKPLEGEILEIVGVSLYDHGSIKMNWLNKIADRPSGFTTVTFHGPVGIFEGIGIKQII